MKKRQYYRAIRRELRYLILCSTRTEEGVETLAEVNAAVRQSGYPDCGHHLVIRRDGTVEACRTLDEPARCSRAHNVEAISVAYIGGMMDGIPFFTATRAQLDAMKAVITTLKNCFPMVEVYTRQDLAGSDPGSANLKDIVPVAPESKLQELMDEDQ